MSDSQEQSLDPDVAFRPVYESSPEFLHCERERRALEILLCEGTDSFHSKLKLERLGAFISPEEVTQIRAWVQDIRCSGASPEEEGQDAGEEDCSMFQKLSVRYWPTDTDTPLPSLQLGWPEKESWPDTGHTLVYTSPPMGRAPPIREVVRRMIQGAQKLIAVVTDTLTDSAVIGDLIGAASRGVPVYVILNMRTAQSNSTCLRLKHQNIRVRVLGGKNFCSRNGKMVTGDLKDNFLLVDLDAVMVGSYSLTWTDAHLHRQLVTVLSGPVVDCFDQEFRILYGASLPIPETWWADRPLTRVENVFLKQDHIPKPLPLDSPSSDEMWSPPPQSPIDWEALGVMQKDQFPDLPVHQPAGLKRQSLPRPPLFESQTLMEDMLLTRRAEFQQRVPLAHVERNRKKHSVTETCVLPDNETTPWNTARAEESIYKPTPRKKFYETDEKQPVQSNRHKTGTRPAEGFMSSPSNQRNEEHELLHSDLRRDGNQGARSRPQVIDPGRASRSPKRPLIIMVPVTENGDTSDFSVLKVLQTAKPVRSNLTRAKGLSMSMQDMSLQSTETDQVDNTLSAWRPKASGHVRPRLTPAQELMKTRKDEGESEAHKLLKPYIPHSRPRTSSFGFNRDWTKLQRDWDKQPPRDKEGGD
ncbi:hypothetical protein AAFF_G00394850 [Aldrovandia affinis]|uniref:Scaffolding anchor of CK1 domain-containing protein n=1 Tax=Aldrovandia affinis TaxID=143900 RepID=A0AAD7SFY3_9TELE|nr:hypothetical protein AAFF_G00394850 [Aldrovandia affinis]